MLNLIYICHRHRKGIRKRDDKVWTLCNVWDFQCGCWQMQGQTMAVPLCMCSGFPTKRLEQMIVMSLYDVTKISHARVGGNYKREGMTEPWGCCYCHLGVLTQVFRSFNKPQTLYFGCLGTP